MTDSVRLDALTVRELSDRLATRDPVPGGGSVAAVSGVLAAALVRMVVELSETRPDLVASEPERREIGRAAATAQRELLELADRDADAFAGVVRARRMPRDTDADRASRTTELRAAMRNATRVPLRTAQVASEVLDLAARVAPIGNPHAASDAGVAAQLASAAVRGAALNVRINLASLADDDPLRAEAAASLERLLADVNVREAAALEAVEARIG
jgi:formiminotetrahydrofolate cyclodeaminase